MRNSLISVYFIFALQFLPQFSFSQQKVSVCDLMTSRLEIYNGASYTKYNVSESAAMRCPQVQATRPAMPWKVLKTFWNAADENQYVLFIQALGRSSCNTVDKCLSQESNRLRSEEDLLFTHYSDCADFPYYLRSYFAYKNNLPMSFTTSIGINPLSAEDAAKVNERRQRILEREGEEAALKYDARLLDERYSVDGNFPKAKMNIPGSAGVARDFGLVGPKIMDQVSSGTLRMLKSPPGGLETDFYSVKLNRNSIRPGTVIYSPSGHVAIVYDVTAKGEVLYIDSHPDNSVTRGSFGPEFPVSRMTHGANFKKFRPFELVDPVFNPDGSIKSAKTKYQTDQMIPDFSLEQYLGNGLNPDGSPNFKINPSDKKNANYYEWVKFKISGGAYRLDPLFEMKNEMTELCQVMKDRINSVQASTDNKIYLKDHPVNLPLNIFGADGEWESYSTPGRDLRLRKKLLDIPISAKDWYDRFNQKDPLVVYSGVDLKQDLIKIYRETVAMCKIVYQNTVGKSVSVGLETLIGRVTQMSYDPYACPERRWGANTAAELNSCSDDQEKAEWHMLQQFMRNRIEKDADAVHGWSLNDLASMNEKKEVDNTPQDERFKIAPKLDAM